MSLIMAQINLILILMCGILELSYSKVTDSKDNRRESWNVAIPDPNYQCPELRGTFTNPEDCGSFYNCWKGDWAIMSCLQGLVYKDEIKGCAYPKDVPGCENYKGWVKPTPKTTKAPVTRDPNYQCPATRGQFANPLDCGSFYNCFDGQFYLQFCPNVLVFNQVKTSCDYPENVPGCEDYDVFQQHIKLQQAMPGAPTKDFICMNNLGVYYKDCQSYYICWNTQAFIHWCPNGFVFNRLKEFCDIPENVPECQIDEIKNEDHSALPELSPINLTSIKTSSSPKKFSKLSPEHSIIWPNKIILNKRSVYPWDLFYPTTSFLRSTRSIYSTARDAFRPLSFPWPYTSFSFPVSLSFSRQLPTYSNIPSMKPYSWKTLPNLLTNAVSKFQFWPTTIKSLPAFFSTSHPTQIIPKSESVFPYTVAFRGSSSLKYPTSSPYRATPITQDRTSFSKSIYSTQKITQTSATGIQITTSIPITSQRPYPCPDTYIFNADFQTCYKVVESLRTWWQSEEFCQKDALLLSGDQLTYCNLSHLAVPRTRKEFFFLLNILDGKFNSKFWLGGNDHLKHGDWRWGLEQEKVEYNMWGPDQPVTINHCLYLESVSELWYSGACDSKKHFICSIKAY